MVRVIKIYEQKRRINISEMSDSNNSDDYCAYQWKYFLMIRFEEMRRKR